MVLCGEWGVYSQVVRVASSLGGLSFQLDVFLSVEYRFCRGLVAIRNARLFSNQGVGVLRVSLVVQACGSGAFALLVRSSGLLRLVQRSSCSFSFFPLATQHAYGGAFRFVSLRYAIRVLSEGGSVLVFALCRGGSGSASVYLRNSYSALYLAFAVFSSFQGDGLPFLGGDIRRFLGLSSLFFQCLGGHHGLFSFR